MKILKLIFFILIATNSIQAQIFSPKIENFTPEDYGKNNNPQNWSVNQNTNGDILFGNNNKLLLFTGEKWKEIETAANCGYITSILPDSNGNIYIGGQGEFGYLKPLQNKYKYISLKSKINNNYNIFSNIWKTIRYKNGILFFSQENLFYYKNDTIVTISPTTSFHNIFIIDDELFVRQRNIGLMKYQNNEFILISNGDVFKDFGIFGMFKNKENNKILLVSQEIGLFTLDENGIKKLKTPDEKTLNSALIFGGTLLKDNNIAINTALSGAVVINFSGKIKYIFNKKNGLADNDIKQIYQDKYNDLWIAANTGVSRIYYSSQISYLDNSTGISGRIKKIAKFNNNIFIATSTGLYKKENTEKFFAKFEKLAINGSVLSLKSTDNYLFAGTKNQLLAIDTNYNINIIEESDASALAYDKEQNYLYSVGENGLSIYSVSNKSINKIKNDNCLPVYNALSLIITKNKPNEIQLWTGTLNEGVINYTVDSLLNINFTIYKGVADGLAEGWAIPFKYNKSFVVGTNSGLMSFIDAETIKSAANDTNIQNIKGIFDLSGLYSDTSAYTDFVQKNNKIWACIDGKIVLIDNKNNKVIKKNFASLDLGIIRTIFPENDNILWAGGDKGLALINLAKQKDFTQKPNIKIDAIYSGDSLIYSSVSQLINNLQLDYEYNNLNFIFSSISNKEGKKAIYSFKLEGFDNDWAEWTEIDKAVYKKINNGNYTFMVKAKDIYGNESKISKISFTINPPWYKTIWAYLLYLILFILLIITIVKLSIRRLKAKNEELERIVQERTKEIAKQRDMLAEQKQEIEDSINYAQRIQQAVLPHKEYFEKILNEYFILFKPKDIVSGDFYWTIKVKNKIIITAADCTGHGVPGAFMSMLGMSFLNQIVRMDKITQANKILIELRKNIIYALKQKGMISEQKDGMDMALCVIDTETYTIEFAGANNPLYIVRNNKLEISEQENKYIKLFEDSKAEIKTTKLLYEIKPDKMPIAIYEKMDDFSNHIIQLEKGDILYMFSDGYADQFGGPKGKKFKYKPFKRTILENADKPMYEQKEILENTFENWGKGYNQIDDVVVIGIKI